MTRVDSGPQVVAGQDTARGHANADHGHGRRWLLGSALAAVGGYAIGQVFPLESAEPAPPPEADLGLRYHQWSTPGYARATGPSLDWGSQPARYKRYPQQPQIELPAPDGESGTTLEATIRARRSQRNYGGVPLAIGDLGRLLYAAQGVTDAQHELRAAPSAGALYPIEIYPVIRNVVGLEAGIYHYAVQTHTLERLQLGDLGARITSAGLGQGHLGQASVCFVLSAIFQRTRWKYHERAYRYVLLEAGHIAENICLAATALGLGACPVGAFLDDEMNGLLGLDGADEATIYIVTVGKG